MSIIVRSQTGFRFLPPPPRVQVPARVSPADTGYSEDEKTQLIIDLITDEANQLDDEATRDLWLDGVETYKKTGNVDALIHLTEYRRKVVTIEDFLFDKSYLGLDEAEVYPGVIEACTNLDTDRYVEAVLKGALGWGKSTTANIMLARNIYKLSCMRHPQSTFGIRSNSSIVFTIQSIRLSTAKKVVFDDFGTYIKNSPYFRNIYPYDPLVTSNMIFREQNVTVMPVSSSTTGAISMNVIGGILDEMNFMQKVLKSKSQHADVDGAYSQAKEIYNNLTRRRKTRFNKKGHLPGLLLLVSSSRFPDDFTEQKAAESTMRGGTDPSIYVIEKTVWDGKGREKFSDEEFTVMIGNNMIRSKVLGANEAAVTGCRTIQVPIEFKNDFEKDIEGSLHDYAGVTTHSTRPFITRRAAIGECVQAGIAAGYQNPFQHEQYCFVNGIPKPDPAKLRTDINIFRHAHIDLGWKRDAAGISIGHIAGQKLIEKTDPVTGKVFSELMPMIGLDVIMRVVPPANGEIEFAHIREFLIMLRDDFDLPIEFVTLDGYQSVDSRQILRTKGFKSDYLSVEKIDAYRSLRDGLYDGRVLMFNHAFLNNELAGLEYVRANNGEDKVDHRANGTKDVADSVCGVSSFLFKRRLAWSPVLNKISSKTVNGSNEELTSTARANVIRKTTVRKTMFRKSVQRRNIARK